MAHAKSLPFVRSLVLQGAGVHFSAGGNPFAVRASYATSPAGFALSLRELYEGFLSLRSLQHPLAAAVHGTSVGGGVAAIMHTDFVAAEEAAALEHGNLVRGMCPLGMLSQTFARRLGPFAPAVYLQNTKLDAPEAFALGLVHSLSSGVEATKYLAHNVVKHAALSSSVVVAVRARAPIDTALLCREAVGHMECHYSNGGFTKSGVSVHRSLVIGNLDIQPVVVAAADTIAT